MSQQPVRVGAIDSVPRFGTSRPAAQANVVQQRTSLGNSMNSQDSRAKYSSVMKDKIMKINE